MRTYNVIGVSTLLAPRVTGKTPVELIIRSLMALKVYTSSGMEAVAVSRLWLIVEIELCQQRALYVDGGENCFWALTSNAVKIMKSALS